MLMPMEVKALIFLTISKFQGYEGSVTEMSDETYSRTEELSRFNQAAIAAGNSTKNPFLEEHLAILMLDSQDYLWNQGVSRESNVISDINVS